MTPEQRQQIFRVVLRAATVHVRHVSPDVHYALATDAAVRIERILDGKETPLPEPTA